MAQPPEGVQPVERQRRLDSQGRRVLALVGPLQAGVLDVRHQVAAGELAIAVRLDPEARCELLAERCVVGEEDAAEPEPILALDGRGIGGADLVRMPLSSSSSPRTSGR